MSVRKWHTGKLIILWTWGGVIVGLILTDFMAHPVQQAPTLRAVELLTILLIPLILSGVTWHWLGGKESP
jgi:hypothetical protein